MVNLQNFMLPLLYTEAFCRSFFSQPLRFNELHGGYVQWKSAAEQFS